MTSRLAALILALGLPLSAHADWSGEGTIISVYSHGGTYFITSTIAASPCGTSGKFWWSASSADAKDMYAMALAAFASDNRIAVHHYPSSPSCMYGGQIINLMYITH